MKTRTLVVSMMPVLMMSFATAEPTDWSVEKAVQELKQGERKLQIVDVRTKEEFKEGHLANAKLVPWTDADFAARIGKELDPAKPVFVYCRSGKRSSEAAKAMEKLGFKEIYTLDGGVIAWEEAGGKLVVPK